MNIPTFSHMLATKSKITQSILKKKSPMPENLSPKPLLNQLIASKKNLTGALVGNCGKVVQNPPVSTPGAAPFSTIYLPDYQYFNITFPSQSARCSQTSPTGAGKKEGKNRMEKIKMDKQPLASRLHSTRSGIKGKNNRIGRIGRINIVKLNPDECSDAKLPLFHPAPMGLSCPSC